MSLSPLQQRNISLALCITLIILLLQSYARKSLISSDSFRPSVSSKSSKLSVVGELPSSSCEIGLGKFEGSLYHNVKAGTVGAAAPCLIESKWMRVSIHSVQLPGSDTIYGDWLWIDYHDSINVLVEDVTTASEEEDDDDNERKEPRFLVFEQTKYGLEGRTSLAVVGGIIEVGEDPISAARREVEEEMNGLVCEKFHFLGRYRTDVNRGMGWTNGFLATRCNRKHDSTNAEADVVAESEHEIGVADIEKQTLKSIALSELRQAVIEGKFIEVKWTATVLLALEQFYSLQGTEQ